MRSKPKPRFRYGEKVRIVMYIPGGLLPDEVGGVMEIVPAVYSRALRGYTTPRYKVGDWPGYIRRAWYDEDNLESVE